MICSKHTVYIHTTKQIHGKGIQYLLQLKAATIKFKIDSGTSVKSSCPSRIDVSKNKNVQEEDIYITATQQTELPEWYPSKKLT